MKKAIFKNILAVLCIYAIFSGFSFNSFANEKVRGFVISSNLEVTTVEKVNNRIVDFTNGSKEFNSYVVNVNNKVDFSLASLLSLRDKAVVVAVSDGDIDDNSKEILKNSKKVYIVGDNKSVEDSLLEKLDLVFERIGSAYEDQTNEFVNKFQTRKDLLVVDKKENLDILGAVHFANIYDMNLLFVDSKSNLTVSQKNIIANLDENSHIYFYDGISTVSYKCKESIYKEAKKDITQAKNFELDTKDILKVFKDRVSIDSKKKKDLVISKDDSLVSMVYSYVFSEKQGLNYLLIKNDEVSDIKDVVENLDINNMFFVSTNDNKRHITIRLLMSLKNSYDFSNFEINEQTSEILPVEVVSSKESLKDVENVSEEVSVKDDEEIKDGKIVSKQDASDENNENIDSVDVKEEQNESNTEDSKDFSYKKLLIMDSTAYSSDGKDPLTPGHITATGQDLWKNPMAVAVDKKVIPLGTRLYVEGYGYTTACDTGGAIKGNLIDLHFKTIEQCHKWGRRVVKVYVLD